MQDVFGMIRLEWIGVIFLFLVLVSIQLTLNKIIVLLNEVIRLLKSKS